jgi:hypothetical protein
VSAPTQQVTQRGLAVIAWVVVFGLLTSALVEWSGLRYVQGIIWPSDLYAFQQTERGPVDVAILGSSRAAFGITPTALEQCLAEKLERPVQAVNLSRAFATAYSLDLLAEDLLRGPRKPRVLVLAIEPELFDERNPRIPINFGTQAGLLDVPEAVLAARSTRAFFYALRPLGRGPETMALYLSGRWDTQPWLRWLMLHHGGGIFCMGSDHCHTHNRAVEDTLDGWWDTVARVLLPRLRESRFPDYTVGTGLVHRHATALLERSEADGVQVVFAELPRLEEFEQHIPAEVEPSYRAYLDLLLDEHPVPHHSFDEARWEAGRMFYVDSEHLNAAGAARYTKELCWQTLAPLMRELDRQGTGD